MLRCSLPSTGSGWVPFPCVSGTTKHSDSLPSVAPRSVAFAQRYRLCATCSFASGRDAPPVRQGFGLRSPDRFTRGRRQGLPGSWRVPMHACPALRPRRDETCQADDDTLARPSRDLSRSAPATGFQFRGSITRPACSLSTLRSVGHPTATQDSLPAGRPASAGRGWLRAGLVRMVSGPYLYGGIPSSIPRLRLAHQIRGHGPSGKSVDTGRAANPWTRTTRRIRRRDGTREVHIEDRS
jgi:hypothetical protein